MCIRLASSVASNSSPAKHDDGTDRVASNPLSFRVTFGVAVWSHPVARSARKGAVLLLLLQLCSCVPHVPLVAAVLSRCLPCWMILEVRVR